MFKVTLISSRPHLGEPDSCGVHGRQFTRRRLRFTPVCTAPGNSSYALPGQPWPSHFVSRGCLRIVPQAIIGTTQRRGVVSSKIEDLHGCGDNPRSRNGESEFETAEPCPAGRRRMARTCALRRCTRPRRVEPLRAGNRYANGDRQLTRDRGRGEHAVLRNQRHFQRKRNSRG